MVMPEGIGMWAASGGPHWRGVARSPQGRVGDVPESQKLERVAEEGEALRGLVREAAQN